MEVARWLGMSYGVVFGALAALIVVVGGIAGLFWWVRRPVPHIRSSPDTPLPLFSHSRAAIWLRDEDDISDESNAEVISARVDQQERSRASTVPSWSVPLPDITAPSARAAAAQRGSAGNAAGGMHAQPQAQSRSRPGSESGSQGTPRQPNVPQWEENGSSATVEPARDAAHEPVPTTVRPRSTAAPAPTPRTPRPVASPPQAGRTTAQPSVQFSVPTDATLQFLPGRLEITTGSDAGREVRFVRLPGASATRVTFGRSLGEPYRHVQLHDATVSRDHAVMHLRDGQWCLVNHSATNPVLHNGVELAQQEDVMLRDGDRIEMGEVTFRFRI